MNDDSFAVRLGGCLIPFITPYFLAWESVQCGHLGSKGGGILTDSVTGRMA